MSSGKFNASTHEKPCLTETAETAFDDVIHAFWRAYRLEAGLIKLSRELDDGRVRSVDEPDVDALIDRATMQQVAIVETLARISPQKTCQLKAKAKVLLAYFESEEDDIQNRLVRSLARDVISLQLVGAAEETAAVPLQERAHGKRSPVLDTFQSPHRHA